MIAVLMLAAASSPARDAGILISSPQPLISLQACATRQLARGADVISVPAEGGVDLDFILRTRAGASNAARYTMSIRDLGDHRLITAAYRHPFSMKTASNITRGAAKTCFPTEWDARTATTPGALAR